jgi:hypothetical protein
MNDLRKKLKIPDDALKVINDFLLDEKNPLINDLLKIIDKYGGIEEINRKAEEASKVENILEKLKKKKPEYVKDIEWLISQRDNNSFISIADYRKKILGDKASEMTFDEDFAITLELSACQYFPFLMDMVRDAVENQTIVPGRIIRVRYMKEHVGMPNDFPLKWFDEYLYYYTNYGIKQVLNVNLGTVLLGYIIHKLGINNEFKISVYLGNDNPYACLWTLMTAKLFAREDGTSPLIGFNLANSVNNETIEVTAYIRKEFGFEDVVRIEHHITETWKSIVRQPYDRRDELMELATKVKNVSAKHEGANVDVDEKREHPTDILEYFMTKEDIKEAGIWEALRINLLDRYEAINTTAEALTKRGLTFIAAKNLHHRE